MALRFPVSVDQQVSEAFEEDAELTNLRDIYTFGLPPDLGQEEQQEDHLSTVFAAQ